MVCFFTGLLLLTVARRSTSLNNTRLGFSGEADGGAELDDLVSTWVSIQGSKDSGSSNHLQLSHNEKIKP